MSNFPRRLRKKHPGHTPYVAENFVPRSVWLSLDKGIKLDDAGRILTVQTMRRTDSLPYSWQVSTTALKASGTSPETFAS